MRRVEHLLLQIRRHTENVQEAATDGISDMEIIQALNDAQESMVSRIHLTSNKILTEDLAYSAVSGQSEYDMPENIFMNMVVNFLWSVTGQDKDLRPLSKVGFRELCRDSGTPCSYAIQGNKLQLGCIPDDSTQSGLLIFNPKLPTLDKRSGKVSAVTLNGGNRTITSLTLSNAFDVSLANANFDETDYLTVVDRDGGIKMKAIPIDSVNTTTGVVSVASGFVYDVGETIAANDYVCLGKYATTHSMLPDTCERFLLMYGYKRLFLRDSSNDYTLQDKELQELMAEIVEILGMGTDDIDYIPEIAEY